MRFYSKSNRNSIAGNNFAREAARDAFCPRDLSLAREPDFVDRRPGNQCQRLAHVATGVVEDLGRAAVRHWLTQAAQAATPKDRHAALKIAAEIANRAGIPLEPFGREAA